jgi:AcrR family transcriptional regulator
MPTVPAGLAPFQSLLPPRATANGTLRRMQEEAVLRFAERGYHAVSVRDIAGAVGIKVSSLYSHLESKEQLLLELMLVGFGEHRDRLGAALLGAGSDPADQLRALMDAHVRMNATYPLLARICNTELPALAPDNRAQVMGVRDSSLQLFIDVIERGVGLGVFHCDDSWLAAAAMGAMGLRVAFWFEARGRYSVDDVAARYAGFALNLVR